MTLTPSRWLPPVLRFTAPPVNEEDREALYRAFDAMTFGFCVIPPHASLEIVEPPGPCASGAMGAPLRTPY